MLTFSRDAGHLAYWGILIPVTPSVIVASHGLHLLGRQFIFTIAMKALTPGIGTVSTGYMSRFRGVASGKIKFYGLLVTF